MKKLLSAVLVLTMVLVSMPFGSNHVNAVENEALSFDAAVAYNTVIENAIKTYGYHFVDNSYVHRGLVVAKLIDFDGNGSLELLIACGREGWYDEVQDVYYSPYFYEVYAYNNGLIKLTEQDCCASMDLHMALSIAKVDNKVYIGTGSDWLCGMEEYYGTVSNNKWVVTELFSHSMEFSENRYVCDICGYDDPKNNWRIDDKPVSFTEYERQTEKFYQNSEFVQINVNEIEQVINRVQTISSSRPITVTLNGKKIDFDRQPVLMDGRTLVPVRAIFEALGATVDWDAVNQTVTSKKGNTTISMTITETTMYKNGQAIELDVAPLLIGGRTLVPVRAVAESFGCKVDWDANTRTVIIK